jgi:MFS transporter, ACS family, tartrate transporter
VLGWLPRVPQPDASALDRARRKAYWRLIPLVFVCYVIAYIDRTNVSLAQLQMGKQLGFDPATFGLGFGMFFIGYVLLEIPGAILVERWSARKWISRIMITWGIIAALQALVHTRSQFYLMRFLLGLAEAGFFPGVIVYLTHWFPDRDRARALALIIIAQPLAQISSPPLSYYLLRLGTTETVAGVASTYPSPWGLEGWQWMFIGWGIPAVVLGVVVLFALTDRPRDARWLTAEERAALEAELERERLTSPARAHLRLVDVVRSPPVLLLAATNFSITCGHYGVESFLPQIFQQWYGMDMRSITWAVPIPYVAMLAAQIGVSWSSDRTRERWWHTCLPMFAGALALLLTPLSRGYFPASVLCFALVMAGIRSYLAPFYTLPKLFLQGTAAAGAIGFINAIANLGGFVGPTVFGQIQGMTGDYVGGILFLAGTSTMAGTLILILRRLYRRRQLEPRPEPRRTVPAGG